MIQSRNKIAPVLHKPVWTFIRKIGKANNRTESFILPDYNDAVGIKALVNLIRGTEKFIVEKSSDELLLKYEDGHIEYLKIDHAHKSFTIQGMWWYRGVYDLIISEYEQSIRLRVYNVATKFRWAASLMILPEQKKHELVFNKLTEDIIALNLKA